MQEKLKFLKNYYEKNNLEVNEINLIGIRDSDYLEKDVINDYLGYWTENEVFLVKGTTEPSVYWTTNKQKRNKKGTFHLKSGFHKSIWCVGKHRGYEALVNDWRYCKPTKGWRDSNYNFLKDFEDIEVCDHFGINFHRMHPIHIVNRIGRYSGGCQVIQDHRDFNKIMSTVKHSKMYTGTSKKTVFNYQLFNIDEIPKFFFSA